MLSAKVQSLVEELRSHKPHGATRKKKKKQKKQKKRKKTTTMFARIAQDLIHSLFMYTFSH